MYFKNQCRTYIGSRQIKVPKEIFSNLSSDSLRLSSWHRDESSKHQIHAEIQHLLEVPSPIDESDRSYSTEVVIHHGIELLDHSVKSIGSGSEFIGDGRVDIRLVARVG